MMRQLSRRLGTLAMAMALTLPAFARRPGEEIKPGFNLFSKQQDIQLGQQAAAEVRKKYQVVQNQELQDYISRVGARLAARSM